MPCLERNPQDTGRGWGQRIGPGACTGIVPVLGCGREERVLLFCFYRFLEERGKHRSESETLTGCLHVLRLD